MTLPRSADPPPRAPAQNGARLRSPYSLHPSAIAQRRCRSTLLRRGLLSSQTQRPTYTASYGQPVRFLLTTLAVVMLLLIGLALLLVYAQNGIGCEASDCDAAASTSTK